MFQILVTSSSLVQFLSVSTFGLNEKQSTKERGILTMSFFFIAIVGDQLLSGVEGLRSFLTLLCCSSQELHPLSAM